MNRLLLFAFTLLVACGGGPEVDPPGPGPENPVVAVTGVSLDREMLALKVGGSAVLAAGIAPQYATNRNVSWSSGDVAVVTVDLLTGQVAAVGVGEAVVTATTLDGGHKATCLVTVEADPGDEPDPDPDDPEDPGDDPEDPPGGDDDDPENPDDPDPKPEPDPDDPGDDPSDPDPTQPGGTAGPLSWTLADGGTMTLGGTGALPDYNSSTPAPWDAWRDRIKRLEIAAAVTRIGANAFAGCENLKGVTVMATKPPALGAGNFTVYGDKLYVPEGCLIVYSDDPDWRAAFTTITE